MTRKLTLFLVCAFEIGLILFVAAWTVHAKTEQLYVCSQWVRLNQGIKITEALREDFPNKMGRHFKLSAVGGNFTIVTELGYEMQIGRIGRHNTHKSFYQTLEPNEFGDDRVFFVHKTNDTITIDTIHPLAEVEYRTTCQK